MGDLMECIERAQRQAEALEVREQVRRDFLKRQKGTLDDLAERVDIIEKQLVDMKTQVAAMSKREADSNAESKQASPLSLHMPFLELSERYGYIAQNGGDAEWVIPVDIVKGWLSSVGIGGLI